MEAPVVIGLLTASFPLGILHAFDPDHLLAVSALAGREDKASNAVSYALNWAAGHAGLLLLISAAVLGFGWILPNGLSLWAERGIGGILIIAGLSVLWKIRQERRERHDAATRTAAFYAPVAVGMVHGTAGSATFLALLPAAYVGSAQGLYYVLVFSLGVAAGMLAFAVVLRFGQQTLSRAAQKLGHLGRAGLAITAISVGMIWIMR